MGSTLSPQRASALAGDPRGLPPGTFGRKVSMGNGLVPDLWKSGFPYPGLNAKARRVAGLRCFLGLLLL
jgi:hypothetical protein